MGKETRSMFLNWSSQKTWQLLEGQLIGSGSFAKVLLAINNETGRKAAVKVMDKQLAGNRPDVLAGEVQVLKYLAQNLNHTRGFARLLDAYEDSRHVYIVLELCTGPLVSELQQELPGHRPAAAAYPHYAPLPEPQVAWIIKQLGAALLQLHSVGVIHRDVKPQNAMFGSSHAEPGTELKLIDFGMASLPQAAQRSESRRRRSGRKNGKRDSSSGSDADVVVTEIMGSEPFIAPEVLQAQSYSPAVDMWALGVTAYLLLSGRHPFHSDEEVLARPVPRFSEAAWGTISAAGCNVVRALLEQRPGSRMRADQLCAHPWLHGARHPLIDDGGSSSAGGVGQGCTVSSGRSPGSSSTRASSRPEDDEGSSRTRASSRPEDDEGQSCCSDSSRVGGGESEGYLSQQEDGEVRQHASVGDCVEGQRYACVSRGMRQAGGRQGLSGAPGQPRLSRSSSSHSPPEEWRQQQQQQQWQEGGEEEEARGPGEELGAGWPLAACPPEAWEDDVQCRVTPAAQASTCCDAFAGPGMGLPDGGLECATPGGGDLRGLECATPGGGDLRGVCRGQRQCCDSGAEGEPGRLRGECEVDAGEGPAACGLRGGSDTEGSGRSGGGALGRLEGGKERVQGLRDCGEPHLGAAGSCASAVSCGRGEGRGRVGWGWRQRRRMEGRSSSCSSDEAGDGDGDGGSSCSSDDGSSSWHPDWRQEAKGGGGGWGARGAQRWVPPVAELAPGTVPLLHEGRRHTLLLVPQLPASWAASCPH